MDKNTNLLIEKIKKLEEENSILKQQQIEITEAKELYLKIFEEFPALIWRSRLDKLCDYFNKTWLEFTGRTMEQEFGNGWAEGVHPDDFDFCVQTYVTAFDKREAFLMEYRMKNKFGEYCWINDFGNLSARGFKFFYPTRIAPFGRIRKRSYQQPTHIAAHLQAPTSQRSNQRLAKELQFCPRTPAFFESFSFLENLNLKNNRRIKIKISIKTLPLILTYCL